MFRRRKNFNDIFSEFDEIFNQFESRFGLPSLNTSTEEGSDEMGDWKKETYTSPNGNIFITSFVRTGNSNENTKKTGLNALKAKLQVAIDEENFEEAVKIRDEIKQYETNQDTIKKLESELKKSIEEQDFENSIKLRDEIKKLKS